MHTHKGLYDNQDVAISVAMRQFEGGSEIEIQTLSDKIEKTTDLMKDISIKLEDIKSDTQKVQDVIYYLDESKISIKAVPPLNPRRPEISVSE